MPNPHPHIAILGAGPIGLEAALYATSLGFPVSVYERGTIADNIQKWNHVRFFSPFGMNASSLGISILRREMRQELPHSDDLLTGQEFIDAYLRPLSNLLRDNINSQTNVVSLGKDGLLKHEGLGTSLRQEVPFRLLTQTANVECCSFADVVLDCTGTYGNHRWLGPGGLPALGERNNKERIIYQIPDPMNRDRSPFASKRTLVIGAGYSAATTVVALAQLAEVEPGTSFTWFVRTHRSQPIGSISNDVLRYRHELTARANQLAAAPPPFCSFFSSAAVTQIGHTRSAFAVTAQIGGEEEQFEADNVVALVGYEPDASIYRELQVHECYASFGPMKVAASLLKQSGGDCLQIPASDAETLKNPEPNFFILGAKSYGRNSNFLLQIGFQQIRDVFRIITQNPTLDLYSPQ